MSIKLLDGTVQSQGIKVSCSGWLDIGSEEYSKTPDQVKAWAYQAAIISGWTDKGIKKVVLDNWGYRITETLADDILETLKLMALEFPVEKEIKDNKIKSSFKISGCDTLLPFPE